MVTDALLAPLLAAVQLVVGWLPDGDPVSVPGLGPVWLAVAQVDSLVPVMGPLVAMLGLLSAVVVFLVVRLVLVVWNLVYP